MPRSFRLLTVAGFVLTIAVVATTPAAQAQATQSNTPQAAAQSTANPLEDSQVSVQPDVAYGAPGGHPLLLDIYQPAEHFSNQHSSNLWPAVILIHGGGWTSFDKSTMRRMWMFLAKTGFVAFSVDYRLLHGTENLWPAQLDDVQRAVRWVRTNSAKYKVDPDHIGAFGHSSGAQLAALLGMEETRDNSDPALAKYSSRVQAVVDVSGPTDFTANHDAEDNGFLSALFGGDYAGHAKVWQDASPAFHVSKDNSPFLIVHGTKDEEVPIAQSQELADKLKQAGVPVTFITVDDVH